VSDQFTALARYVRDSVAQRGYLQAYSKPGAIARQVGKVGEELAELDQQLHFPPQAKADFITKPTDIHSQLAQTGQTARKAFDDLPATYWNQATVTDPYQLAKELADSIIPLLTAAAIIKRGVR